MVSKSANYCYSSPDNPTGLLLLAEVALGEPYELLGAKTSLKKAPKGFDSVKGCGKTMPDPSGESALGDDGEDAQVIVPTGKGVPSTEVSKSELLYNEYIVYKSNQVKLRYLVRLKFVFK